MKQATIKGREVTVYLLSDLKKMDIGKKQYHKLGQLLKKHNKKFDDKIVGFIEIEDGGFIQVYESEVK